jgi:molybdopterin-guanine dinucleotide biosynthesis protein A
MGGDKALVELDGSLLIERPLAALRAAGIEEVVVVAKRETVLPLGTTVWLEPDEPRHPLTGLVHALRTADGPVFVVAADLALLDAATVARVLGAAQPDDLAVVPDAGGRLQPLCALYAPAAFSAADGAHRPRRLDEARLVDVVLELLAPDGVADERLELVVEAPARSGSRRSVSCSEKRQVRSLPSAVRRMRLQSAQNGSETGLMKPISPLPSAKRKTRAVACGSRGSSSSG